MQSAFDTVTEKKSMFHSLGIALIVWGAAVSTAQAIELTGEVTVIELNDGATVTVEQAQTREIAGQHFIGGKVHPTEGKPGRPKTIGNRIWIAGNEVRRIIEFDTKAQFTAAQQR